MPTLRYVVVDVFTDTPLAGNQLAVFTDARELDGELMQALALEIGFSETTFVLPAEEGGHARVRIFNPAHEMAFAGHPILGTAWVLAQPLQRSVIELETGMGSSRSRSSATSPVRSSFGRMQQPVPTVTRARRDGRALRRAGRGGIGAPRRAVRQRSDAHHRDARERGRRSRRSRPTQSAIARFERHGCELHLRRR